MLFNKLCLIRVIIKVFLSLFFTVSLFLLVLAHSDLLLYVFHVYDYELFLRGNLSGRIDLVLGLKLDSTREDLSLLQSSSFLALSTQVSFTLNSWQEVFWGDPDSMNLGCKTT